MKKHTSLTHGTSTSGNVATDITDLNADTIVAFKGTTKVLTNSNETYWRDIIHAYAYNSTSVSEFSGVFIKNNTMNFRYSGLTSMSTFTVYINLYYTKTTDTATRGNVEQLRSMNTGSNSGDLVGIGDRAEIGEIETKEEAKVEPLEVRQETSGEEIVGE